MAKRTEYELPAMVANDGAPPTVFNIAQIIVELLQINNRGHFAKLSRTFY